MKKYVIFLPIFCMVLLSALLTLPASAADVCTNHDFVKSTVLEEANCWKDGKQLWVCTNCQSEKTTVIGKTGHDMTKVVSSEPSCVTPKNPVYWHCNNCDQNFRSEKGLLKYSGMITTTTSHKFTYITAVAPTCTKNGTVACYLCTECKRYYLKSTDSTPLSEGERLVKTSGHTIVEIKVGDATCVEDGATTGFYRCTGCGQCYSDNAGANVIDASAYIIPKKGHVYDGFKVVGDTVVRTCKVCPLTETVLTVDRDAVSVTAPYALSGMYLVKGSASSTVTLTAGTKNYTVKLNATGEGAVGLPTATYAVPSGVTLTPVAHRCMGEFAVAKAATETAQGTMTRTCEYCGNVDTVATAKVGSRYVYTDCNYTFNTGCDTFRVSVAETGVYEIAFKYVQHADKAYLYLTSDALNDSYSGNHTTVTGTFDDGYSKCVFNVYLTSGVNEVKMAGFSKDNYWNVSGIRTELICKTVAAVAVDKKNERANVKTTVPDEGIYKISGDGITTPLVITLAPLVITEDGEYDISLFTNSQNNGTIVVNLTDAFGNTVQLRSQSLDSQTYSKWTSAGTVQGYGIIARYSDCLYQYDPLTGKAIAEVKGHIQLEAGTYNVTVTDIMTSTVTRVEFGGAVFVSDSAN